MESIERTTAIGIDLRDDISEISYCRHGEMNVITYSYVADGEDFEIPTAACYSKEDERWFYGREAVELSEKSGAILINSLVTKALAGGRVFYNDNDGIDSVKLLGMFILYCLSVPGELSVYDTAALVITVEEVIAELPKVLDKALQRIKGEISTVRYMGHEESFFYYAMSQPIELWQRGVVLYDYGRKSFKRERLMINSQYNPATVFTDEKSFDDMIPFKEEEEERFDNMFREISENEFVSDTASAVYLTGDIFRGRWADKTFRFLCTKSRVFVGQNLYTKGACFAAADLSGWTRLGSRYIFMDETRLHSSISARTVYAEREGIVPLVSAGISWYDVDASAEFMLSSDRRIELLIQGDEDEGERNALIRCDWIPERPERASRILLHLSCPVKNQLKVEITDLGFGEIFRSTGLTKEEIVNLED
ncbi:MAG: hypothetical protein K5894_09165 [Lachnospiraceae bacterium]|nr:hypothetical protein [Lachnospiraceae bacterium]